MSDDFMNRDDYDHALARAATHTAAHPDVGVGELTHYRLFDAGEVLFEEGQRGAEAYVIKTGEVRITKSIDGTEQDVGVLCTGSIVGEMAVISDMPRIATATASEETLCVALSRQAVQIMMSSVDLDTLTLITFLIHQAQAKLDGDRVDEDELKRNERILSILLKTPEQMEKLDKLEPFFVLLCHSLLERAKGK